MKKTVLMISALCLAFAASACTTKRVEGTKVPVKKTTTTPKKSSSPADSHDVVKGDTLWDISGSGSAYSDNMQWPLLFKYNRDIIKDPDLIYPGQNLKIQKNVTEDEVKRARKAASDTPPYQPHTTPRETLPLDYF